MNAFPCPPYPHFSWLAHWLSVSPSHVFHTYECRHVTHRIQLMTAGDAAMSWNTGGHSVAFHVARDDISFLPQDDGTHTLSCTTAHGFESYSLLIPADHVRGVYDAEGLQPRAALLALPVFRDTLMRASILRLSKRDGDRSIAEDVGDEIAARHVILRLCALTGGSLPEWQRDNSVFTVCDMRRIAADIDASLETKVSLAALAGTIALSPGHFARKFRHSTGLSLNRFINVRRIGMSFAMLDDHDRPLTAISLALGFSSQSHFTRLFSGLTGMTPQRFRQLHMRSRG